MTRGFSAIVELLIDILFTVRYMQAILPSSLMQWQSVEWCGVGQQCQLGGRRDVRLWAGVSDTESDKVSPVSRLSQTERQWPVHVRCRDPDQAHCTTNHCLCWSVLCSLHTFVKRPVIESFTSLNCNHVIRYVSQHYYIIMPQASFSQSIRQSVRPRLAIHCVFRCIQLLPISCWNRL